MLSEIAFAYGTATTKPAQRPGVYATTARRQAFCESTVTDIGTSTPLLYALPQGYCQEVFETLAARNPNELLDIVLQSRGPTSRLTYAAEILGRDVPTAAVANALMRVLREHPSPLVREGAILGLAHHLHRSGVRDSLAKAAQADPSPGVRRAATETLED
jgi:hypothetical protein